MNTEQAAGAPRAPGLPFSICAAPRENAMIRSTIAALAATAGLAGILIAGCGHAAPAPAGVTARQLETAIKTGATVEIDGVAYSAQPVQPTCLAELAAYRLVARQAAITPGGTAAAPLSQARTWARELAPVNGPLAQTAAGTRTQADAVQLVIALRASVAAAIAGTDGCSR